MRISNEELETLITGGTNAPLGLRCNSLALDLRDARVERERLSREAYGSSTIRWYGSVTDLATDCAHLLTREQGLALAAELERFARTPRLHEKFAGKGFEEEPARTTGCGKHGFCLLDAGHEGDCSRREKDPPGGHQ